MRNPPSHVNWLLDTQGVLDYELYKCCMILMIVMNDMLLLWYWWLPFYIISQMQVFHWVVDKSSVDLFWLSSQGSSDGKSTVHDKQGSVVRFHLLAKYLHWLIHNATLHYILDNCVCTVMQPPSDVDYLLDTQGVLAYELYKCCMILMIMMIPWLPITVNPYIDNTNLAYEKSM